MFKKIQEKPENVKKRISLILTLVIFGAIVFVWLSSWGARTNTNESRAQTASPIESFKEIFTGGISDISNSIINTEFFGGGTEDIGTDIVLPPVVEQRPASSSSRFDMSGVVIIDLATSTKSTR